MHKIEREREREGRWRASGQKHHFRASWGDLLIEPLSYGRWCPGAMQRGAGWLPHSRRCNSMDLWRRERERERKERLRLVDSNLGVTRRPPVTY